jgi:glycosyltransferase involved in cell wall biosynthesis
MKTIVVSAVNIRKGGTLTILRDCLRYLSSLSQTGEYRVVALVHKEELVLYPGIEYIEIPWTVKNWILRLWCEYVTMYRISKRLSPVFLWLSLHDTTPRVKAQRQSVYCQTSFPFYRWNFRDFVFDYKIVLFSLFTKFVYKINADRNTYLIVQQVWLRKNISRICHLAEERFVVSPPEREELPQTTGKAWNHSSCCTFLFASTPDIHKNFELFCMAATRLEKKLGKGRFKVYMTISGYENRYARWLYRKWGKTDSIEFIGFLTKEALYRYYETVDCLVFPSKVETWGLPISEFSVYGKPMLLANLPYAHESACGSLRTAFFSPYEATDLEDKMRRLIEGDTSFLSQIDNIKIESPSAYSWKELFNLLLQ